MRGKKPIVLDAGGRQYRLMLVVLLVILLCSVMASLTLGRYGMSVGEALKILLSKVVPIENTWDNTQESVVMRLRLPRTLAAALIGAALALSGASYQSMFKNPMVSPDLLGVSSGACIGASLAITLSLSSVTIQVWAFLGGIAAVTLTTAIPKLLGSQSTVMLVLSGVIVGGLMSSIMGIIRYFADPDTALAQMTYWAMGSLADVQMVDLAAIGPFILAAGILLLLMRFRLNVLSLGEQEAKTLGVDIKKSRAVVIVCATILTASSVCIAGTIGWIGLVVPHLGRMMAGPDNRKMLPLAVLLGASFMIWIDLVARTITSAELPISIITGIIGAPFYFYLLFRQRNTLR